MAHNYNIITDLIKKVNWEILCMYKVTISPPFSTYDAGWSLMWKLALLFASQWLLSTQVGFCLLLPSQPCSHFLFPWGPQLLQLSSASSAHLTPGYWQHQVGSACGIVDWGESRDCRGRGRAIVLHQPLDTKSLGHFHQWPHTCERCPTVWPETQPWVTGCKAAQRVQRGPAPGQVASREKMLAFA